MTERTECLRLRYLGDVTGAMYDYVARGGSLRFKSDRSGPAELAIEFEFDDAALYDSMLFARMTRSAGIQELLL